MSDSAIPDYSPWNSPGQNTGVGSLSLHQGYLPNPGIKPRSPASQAESLPAEPQGKLINLGAFFQDVGFNTLTSTPRNLKWATQLEVRSSLAHRRRGDGKAQRSGHARGDVLCKAGNPTPPPKASVTPSIQRTPHSARLSGECR